MFYSKLPDRKMNTASMFMQKKHRGICRICGLNWKKCPKCQAGVQYEGYYY